MASFKFDPSKHGLRKTLKEYEEVGLRHVWSMGEEGVGSGKTWVAVNEALGPDKSISRASVIFFLNRMVDQGVLSYRTGTPQDILSGDGRESLQEAHPENDCGEPHERLPRRDEGSPRGITALTSKTLSRSPVYLRSNRGMPK